MWCEHANMCITSNDKDTHKVDGCRKKSSIVDVSREPKPIEEEEETTPTVNEAGLRNELRQTTNNTETHLSSIVDVPGEPALIEKKEKTTPTINEADLRNELRQTTSNTETHLNVTTDTTDDEEQKKSRNYSYIIVPVIVTFIVVCSGCVIGLWFYRKKRSMP
ncbi:hypothetical protein MS3_00002450 [Schistosoma haematobium]|uniref:Uncharacterized protein n=1 Tax=Schistosoma haematobium TaxID=6185 RepID=A0A922LZX2_SCHHA|nr:hypothetical protein MS3_00002450 [Schistosoma haematobium]KAH9596950.1 hypothetical protein MS3_00002450 [Schistosoma haematobium]